MQDKNSLHCPEKEKQKKVKLMLDKIKII